MPVDHVCFPVKDFQASLTWYLKALEPLGYKIQQQFEHQGTKIAGLGVDGSNADLWIWQGGEGDRTIKKGLHLGFAATSHERVNQFYEAAIAGGATDNGKPGPRPHYGPSYYGAFVYDFDGNNIEAVCRSAGSEASA